MKNFGIGIIALLAVTFLSCASLNPSFGITSFGQKATTTRDTLEGKMTAETFVVVPIGMSMSSDDDMGLKIGRVKRGDNIISYYFRAEVHTSNWIFAEGIGIKIDDKTYRLSDRSPNRQVQSGQYVIEILTFDITPEMLEKLRNAETFTAELYRRVVTISPEQLVKVKEFIQIPGTKSGSNSFTGDPSGVLVGTWSSLMFSDLKFEENRFSFSSSSGNSTVIAYMGFFSYNDKKLVLNVTGGILSEKWIGEHMGNAVVNGDNLVLSGFEGEGAASINTFSFTRKK